MKFKVNLEIEVSDNELRLFHDSKITELAYVEFCVKDAVTLYGANFEVSHVIATKSRKVD